MTFRNVNLLAKFYLIIMPLFLIAVALSIYLNYIHERSQVLELTESFARTQAMAAYNLVVTRIPVDVRSPQPTEEIEVTAQATA